MSSCQTVKYSHSGLRLHMFHDTVRKINVHNQLECSTELRLGSTTDMCLESCHLKQLYDADMTLALLDQFNKQKKTTLKVKNHNKELFIAKP